MFTGLIEAVQPVLEAVTTGEGRRLVIDLGRLAADTKTGDSICVNGACLTVSRLQGSVAEFEVMAQTLRLSTLGGLRPREMVNLERALRADGRLGGHLVQGHADAVGAIERVEPGRDEHALWVRAPREVMNYLIPQGSVALDGVSLTVGKVEGDRFAVFLIPTTLRETNLQYRRAGDPVNLEADLIGKWIRRRLDEVLPGREKNSGQDAQATLMEKLRQQGF